jgi:two-component system, NarL family, captular synthesis response regulator RcsB
MALRVIVADDHPIVLIAVRALLERDGLCRIVAHAATTDDLVEKLDANECDVLVTDYAMPGHGEIRYNGVASFVLEHPDQFVDTACFADDFDTSIVFNRWT